jgi:hypothetical protein
VGVELRIQSVVEKRKAKSEREEKMFQDQRIMILPVLGTELPQMGERSRAGEKTHRVEFGFCVAG